MMSSARYAAGAAPCTLLSATKRPLATAWSQASPRSIGRTLDLRSSPLRTGRVQISDCSRKSAPSKRASAIPRSKTCCALELLVLVERVLDDHR